MKTKSLILKFEPFSIPNELTCFDLYNVQCGSYFAEILRFELKTCFEKSAKIGKKLGINFDELPCIIL